MRPIFSLSLMILAACGEAHIQQVPPGSHRTVDDAPDFDSMDTQDTSESMVRIAARIDQLPDQQRAQAAESLRFLSVDCPYTRAALQLPFVLHQGVMAVNPDTFEGPARTEWVVLQQGLALHVGVLDALDIDLPLPGTSDYLYQGLGLLTDRTTLMSAPNHVAMTLTFVQAVPDLAQQTDADTRARIEEHSARVEQATGVIRQCPRGPWSVMPGHPWTLGEQLGEWHDGLKRVQATAEDPVTSEQIGTMIALLDEYVEATQAHIGAH